MKNKQRSTEELTALYKEGLPLDAALEKHFRNLGLWPVSDEDFLTIQLVIGFSNLGVTDKIVSLSGDRKLNVAQVIETYKLRPFLESE